MPHSGCLPVRFTASAIQALSAFQGSSALICAMVMGRRALQFTPLAINAGLDRSGNGGANLQVLIPQLVGWICRQRQAAATEALKPLVVER